jgi:hypothetical protein
MTPPWRRSLPAAPRQAHHSDKRRMTLDALVQIERESGSRPAVLSDFLDAEREESAACEANAWIKALRHAEVDGVPFRQRFTYRGDSLWWFAELYLHKERTILSAFRAAHAAEALILRERPRAIRLVSGGDVVRVVLPQVSAAHQVRYHGPSHARGRWRRICAMDMRSAGLAAAALAAPRPRRTRIREGVTVAAFVHRAFWRTDVGDGSAESYIGPVLKALEAKLPREALAYVGVGPATNFRARRWWRPAPSADAIDKIEAFAPRRALAGSWRVWRSRHATRRAMERSDGLRRAAIIRGCDSWPIVREALAGIALLQFPWSVRAMDEAAAAFDALRPAAAVTYAEAGGWGRALGLEARRRRIPLVGLQHGFIYRHWLNYRHEPDEMAPLDGVDDGGFPRPSLTLVFDAYAADHLVQTGRFPPDSIAVTGSPRLDALAAEMTAFSAAQVAEARHAAGATADESLVLIVSKYAEIRDQLRGVLDALRRLPGIRAAIKTHPAETSAPYERAAAGVGNLRVLPASTPLAPLLRGAQAILTVNSTVAIDGLALGIPALSVGLPNNLSPFVAAGAMMGTAAPEEIAPALERLLYDRGFRQQVSDAAAALAGRYRIAPDGRAAERAALAILQLAADRSDT